VGEQKYFLLPDAGYPCYATDRAMSALITLYRLFSGTGSLNLELIEGRGEIDKTWGQASLKLFDKGDEDEG